MARPHDTDEFTAIGFLYEVVAGLAGVVGGIALVRGVCNVQIGDQDEVKVLFAEI